MSGNQNPIVVLSRFGIVVDQSVAISIVGEKTLTKLLRELTFEYQAETAKGPRGPVKIYHAYQIIPGGSGARLILPRSAHSFFPKYRIRVPAGKVPVYREEASPLLPHQTVLINHFLGHEFSNASLDRGLGAATLVLGTGQGKTFVAMGIARALGLRLLYITKNKSLCRQAELDMELFLGPAGSDPSWRAVVINSALNMQGIENFGMVVLDEVNEYCTPVFGQIFFQVQCRALFAMTATLARRDGFEKAALALCTNSGKATMAADIPGGTMNSAHFDKRAVLLHYYARPEYAQSLKHDSTGEVFMHYMYEQYTSDPDRIAIVAEKLRELYLWRGRTAGECHTIYMFADEVKTLETYRNYFEAHPPPGYSPDQSILFVGAKSGAESDLITRARLGGRILWATYSYGSVGVSISRATAAISINGRVSGWEQCLGRITRAGSDPTIPRIFIDVIDSGTCMAGQIRRRRNIYDQQGYKTTKETYHAH